MISYFKQADMKARVVIFCITVIYWVALSEAKVISIDCPENCLCDIFHDLKRATCVQKKLISIDADIPRQTDILDLSNNYISTLDENEFRRVRLESLKHLNISYNKLSKVHFYAFGGMGKLKVLDLSHNAITYTHGQWFADMSSIQSIYLEYNNFFALHYDSAPDVFNSKTLKSLNLANTNIAYIDRNFFAKLPALVRLDLSSNSLIQLDVKAISSLSTLQELHIEGNEISCNQELSTYCTTHGIQLYGDNCAKAKPSKTNNKKFEKMVLDPKIEEKPPVNDINGWLIEGIEVDDLDYEISNCSTMPETKSSTFLGFYAWSPFMKMAGAMIVGLILGVAIGVTISYSCSQTRHLITADAMAKRRSHRRRRLPSIRMSLQRLSSLGSSNHSSIHYSPQSPIVSYEQYNSETTPITPRKTYDTRPLF